jgi:hypothetical protein
MENREFLDEVQNHVHNRLHPEQGCSSSADAPNSAQREKIKLDAMILYRNFHNNKVQEQKNIKTRKQLLV